MYWRYDVHTCDSDSTGVGAHDSDCRGWHRVGMYPGQAWFDAYLAAENLPHGVVIRVYTGPEPWGAGSIVDVFEHVTGGRLCMDCGHGRGPQIADAMKDRFLCPICVGKHRRATAWANGPGTEHLYRPRIDLVRREKDAHR